jgi:SAM-dependent methyltransferase
LEAKVKRALILNKVLPKEITPDGRNTVIKTYVLENVAETFIRGKTILDVGCYDGYWSKECLRLGATKVTGVDNYQYAAFSDGTYDQEIPRPDIEGDAETVELPSVDTVLAFDVLYCLKDVQDFLSKLRCCFLICNFIVPSADGKMYKTPYYEKANLKTFEKSDVVAMLTRAGFTPFEVVQIQDRAFFYGIKVTRK